VSSLAGLFGQHTPVQRKTERFLRTYMNCQPGNGEWT
jgi:hypothetical protein